LHFAADAAVAAATTGPNDAAGRRQVAKADCWLQ